MMPPTVRVAIENEFYQDDAGRVRARTVGAPSESQPENSDRKDAD